MYRIAFDFSMAMCIPKNCGFLLLISILIRLFSGGNLA